METTNASLIVCHRKNDFRALKEREGTGNRYLPTGSETKTSVQVRPPSVELLKKELAELSIIVDDIPTIKTVANKFHEELVTKKGGKLAWDEDTHEGLFEIV